MAAKIAEATRPHPYLRGKRSIFGVMPDWNPAEIIGVRPRPLALSQRRLDRKRSGIYLSGSF